MKVRRLRRYRSVSPHRARDRSLALTIVIGLLLLSVLGLAWTGWWIWVFLIFFFGSQHAEPLDLITKLDTSRKLLALFTLILFFFIFIPVPLRLITGPYFGP